MFVCNGAPRRYVVALVLGVLLINTPLSEGKRSLSGGGRKTSSSSGGYSTRRQPQTSVTKPTYNTNSGNSHAEQAKLSYPNYNSQPNRPANAAPPPASGQQQPIGWNVPNQGHAAGPPPAYSPSNVAGGAKTNMHEPPPVYSKPNYAAPPPNYAQATGTQYGGAPSYPGQMPAGATYHSSGSVPAGATYYNNPSHVPGYGGGGGYPGGGYPAGGGYPMQGGYHAPAGVPAGATYVPAGGALPPGAVLYSSPPQQSSSGLGFGSGLVGGAIGGAILGHVLTPSHSGGSAPAPAPVAGNSGSGEDRIIIINANGEPVKATTVNGATVINTGAPAAPGAAPVADAGTPAVLAPILPVPNDGSTAQQNMTSDAHPMPAAAPMPIPPGMPVNTTDNTAPMNPEQQPPAPGGIICVPVRVNDTDPTDATKMIEVEKIACYPAPPPAPPVVPETTDANNPQAPSKMPADGSAPLAPMQPVIGGSQQLQQATLVSDENIKQASSASTQNYGIASFIVCFLASYLVGN